MPVQVLVLVQLAVGCWEPGRYLCTSSHAAMFAQQRCFPPSTTCLTCLTYLDLFAPHYSVQRSVGALGWAVATAN